MSRKLPKDCSARAICTRARGIFAYELDAESWEWHEQTGTDHGTDIVLELSENELFTGYKVNGQLKGTTKLERLKNGEIKFDLEVKTINYALTSFCAFVLFLVDVIDGEVYFLPLQEYFISTPSKFEALYNNKSTVSLHINSECTLSNMAEYLVDVSKRVYKGGATNSLRVV